MWKPLLILLMALAIGASFTACQNAETINEPQALKGDPPFDPNVDEQLYLADLYQYSETLRYDEIQGTVLSGFGGTVTGHPSSWGEEYVFSVFFPPGSVPGYPGSIIPITISVPHYDERYDRAVYKLEPDMDFNSDVTVTLCLPPWLTPFPSYRTFCFFQLQNPDYYGISDEDTLLVIPIQNDVTTLTFQTNHFSRWHPDPEK